MSNKELILEVTEAISWVEYEYGFVTDVLKKCLTYLRGTNWQSMDSAPIDGTIVLLYVEKFDDLPAFITKGSYHQDAGWCVDELREAIAWMICDTLEKPTWAK